MAELVALDIADYESEVKQEVVDILRRLLARAERGDIQEIVVASVLEDGQYMFTRSRSLDVVIRVGMLEVAKQEALGEWLSNAEEAS